MRQRLRGLTWLDGHNSRQREWAHNYLREKGLIVGDRQFSTRDELLAVGEILEAPERQPNGQKTIQRMRNAWQQAKFRAPDKDRKACTFKLKTKVKKDLAVLAKANNTNETDMLNRLITEGVAARTELGERLRDAKEAARETKERHKKEIDKLKRAIKNSDWHSDDLMKFLEVSVELLCRDEVLLQSASISTRYIPDAQQREIERLRNQTMKETKRALAGKMNLRPTGLLELAIAEKISASRKKEAVTKEAAKDWA